MDYELAWLMVKNSVADVIFKSNGSNGVALFNDLKKIEERCKRPINDPETIKRILRLGCDILEESVNAMNTK